MFKHKEKQDEIKNSIPATPSIASKSNHQKTIKYRNIVFQRAAIFAGPDTAMGEARMAQLDSAAKKVGSKFPMYKFLVDKADAPPRPIKSATRVDDGKSNFVKGKDHIDIFGHSRDSMPAGIDESTLSNKIGEVLDVHKLWEGDIRIFSCYGGDKEQKYNVGLAKEFSKHAPGLQGVGGSTKAMNIGKTDGDVSKVKPLDVKKGQSGWTVALRDTRTSKWVRNKKSFRGSGPGQLDD
jgi:hypothetical protein